MNGQTEAHFGVKMGTGAAMRVGFIPEKAEYRLRVSGRGSASDVHMYSVLRDMGVPDDQLAELWGSEVLERNKAGYDPRALDRAYKKLVIPRLQIADADNAEKTRAINEALDRARVHKKVLERTLPNYFDRGMAQRWKLGALAKSAAHAVAEPPSGLALYFQMRKCAAFTRGHLVQLAELLNRELNAGIYMDGTKEQIEASILDFINRGGVSGAEAIGAAMPGAESLAALGKSLEKQHFSAPDMTKMGAAAETEEDTLNRLLDAKSHSDKKRYAAKHAILSGLLLEKPGEFVLDSEQDGIAGVTHTPTNFRIHVPSRYVPQAVRQGGLVKTAAVIGVDLDGTLAKNYEGKFNPEKIGEPVPAMLRRVKRAIKDGHEIRIFTARTQSEKNIPHVRAWLGKHGLPEDLPVTNEKTDEREIWDNIAVAVEADTGKAASRNFFDLVKDAAAVRTFDGENWYVFDRAGESILALKKSAAAAYDTVAKINADIGAFLTEQLVKSAVVKKRGGIWVLLTKDAPCGQEWLQRSRCLPWEKADSRHLPDIASGYPLRHKTPKSATPSLGLHTQARRRRPQMNKSQTPQRGREAERATFSRRQPPFGMDYRKPQIYLKSPQSAVAIPHRNAPLYRGACCGLRWR